jgi:hypothetical protein
MTDCFFIPAKEKREKEVWHILYRNVEMLL